ncbi:MAG: hypothetical protein ABIS36_22975 [Chryseolinea sp.]
MNKSIGLLRILVIALVIIGSLPSCKSSAATNKHELKKEMKYMDHNKRI